MDPYPVIAPNIQLSVSRAGDGYRAHYLLSGANRWGQNWRPGEWSNPLPAQFGRACQRAKWRLGYALEDCTATYGPKLHSFLVPLGSERAAPLPPFYRVRRRNRLGKPNPFAEPKFPDTPWPFKSRDTDVVPWRLNGCPYQGSHTRGNWESDRAVDLNVPIGTPVIAIWDGVLNGPQGPIYSDDPQLMGQRLHLRRDDGAEAYYAHLSSIRLPEGTHVKRGDVLGLSGSAAGVAHLHIATIPMRPDDYLAVGGCE
jgi:murein DD-endopeptidase MepM/ murein hydrolase activator NlpD